MFFFALLSLGLLIRPQYAKKENDDIFVLYVFCNIDTKKIWLHSLIQAKKLRKGEKENGNLRHIDTGLIGLLSTLLLGAAKRKHVIKLYRLQVATSLALYENVLVHYFGRSEAFSLYN